MTSNTLSLCGGHLVIHKNILRFHQVSWLGDSVYGAWLIPFAWNFRLKLSMPIDAFMRQEN